MSRNRRGGKITMWTQRFRLSRGSSLEATVPAWPSTAQAATLSSVASPSSAAADKRGPPRTMDGSRTRLRAALLHVARREHAFYNRISEDEGGSHGSGGARFRHTRANRADRANAPMSRRVWSGYRRSCANGAVARGGDGGADGRQTCRYRAQQRDRPRLTRAALPGLGNARRECGTVARDLEGITRTSPVECGTVARDLEG